MDMASGTFVVHSAPRAVVNHIEWAVNGLIGAPQRFRWREYPDQPGLVKLSLSWAANSGFASKLASTLRGWSDVRFEIFEDPTNLHPGVLVMHTPALGLYTAEVNQAGSVVLSADRLRALVDSSEHDFASLQRALRDSLGEQWEQELEPYRRGEPVLTVPQLHAVG